MINPDFGVNVGQVRESLAQYGKQLSPKACVLHVKMGPQCFSFLFVCVLLVCNSYGILECGISN